MSVPEQRVPIPGAIKELTQDPEVSALAQSPLSALRALLCVNVGAPSDGSQVTRSHSEDHPGADSEFRGERTGT